MLTLLLQAYLLFATAIHIILFNINNILNLVC